MVMNFLLIITSGKFCAQLFGLEKDMNTKIDRCNSVRMLRIPYGLDNRLRNGSKTVSLTR
jgi:hypothetical protein